MWLTLISLASAADLVHQGRALDALGNPAVGPASVQVTLWTLESGGTAAWTQTYSETLESGYFTVTLGLDASNKPVEDALSVDGAVWLEVSVDGVGQGQRQRLASVPSAVTAQRITSVGDGSTRDHAAVDCGAILSAHGSTRNGLYWIDPDGDGITTDAFLTWCDMTGGGWTLVMQNNYLVRSDALDPTYAQTLYSTHVRGGAISDDLGTFDYLLGLDFWDEIGTEGRLTMGNTPGVAERTATFASLTVDANDSYRLSMTAPTLSGTTIQPGLYTGHNGRTWQAIDTSGTCAVQYGHPWWYHACWSGALWGSDKTHSPRAYWTSSTVGSNSFNWGALWLR